MLRSMCSNTIATLLSNTRIKHDHANQLHAFDDMTAVSLG